LEKSALSKGAVVSVRIGEGVPKEMTMKTLYFENTWNKEKFTCPNAKDIRVIDGIEYLRVFKHGTHREVLVRKDQLKKVKEFTK